MKKLVTPPTCLPKKGSSEEGMSEHYRNCLFILSKRTDKADQAVRRQTQPKPGADLSAREDSSKQLEARPHATSHCLKGNKQPRVKYSSGVYAYFWSFQFSSHEQYNEQLNRLGSLGVGGIKELKQDKQKNS